MGKGQSCPKRSILRVKTRTPWQAGSRVGSPTCIVLWTKKLVVNQIYKLPKIWKGGKRQIKVDMVFSWPEQLIRWPCHSLSHSLTQGTLLIDIQRATQETCDLWDIWLERWGDTNWPKKDNDKDKYKDNDNDKDKKKIRELHQRAIPETCDLWDIWWEW